MNFWKSTDSKVPHAGVFWYVSGDNYFDTLPSIKLLSRKRKITQVKWQKGQKRVLLTRIRMILHCKPWKMFVLCILFSFGPNSNVSTVRPPYFKVMIINILSVVPAANITKEEKSFSGVQHTQKTWLTRPETRCRHTKVVDRSSTRRRRRRGKKQILQMILVAHTIRLITTILLKTNRRWKERNRLSLLSPRDNCLARLTPCGEGSKT